jgi:hypothetical protein
VVTVSSGIAARGKIDFEDLPADHSYQWFASYARSKLANLMFAPELDHRAKDGKAGLAGHLGAASSSLLAGKERDLGPQTPAQRSHPGPYPGTGRAVAPARRPDYALRGDRGRPDRRRVHRTWRTDPLEGSAAGSSHPRSGPRPCGPSAALGPVGPAHRNGLCGAHLTPWSARPQGRFGEARDARRWQGSRQAFPDGPRRCPRALVPGSRGPITLVR